MSMIRKLVDVEKSLDRIFEITPINNRYILKKRLVALISNILREKEKEYDNK